MGSMRTRWIGADLDEMAEAEHGLVAPAPAPGKRPRTGTTARPQQAAPGKRSLTAQCKATQPGPAALRLTPPGPGAGLPAALIARAAATLDLDARDVRVHVDGQAEAIGATAFAVGDDLYFAPGAYDPQSPGGRELIGHELAHVAQQRRGVVPSTAADAGAIAIVADPALEAEADRAGRTFAAGGGRYDVEALIDGVSALGAPLHREAPPPPRVDTATAVFAARPATEASVAQPAGLAPAGAAPSATADRPPRDAAEALVRWERGYLRFKRLFEAGLRHTPPASESEPSFETRFRNACQWIDEGEVALVLMAPAPAPAPPTSGSPSQQALSEPLYFDEQTRWPDTTPNLKNATPGYSKSYGWCDGETLWLVDLAHPSWTDREIQSTVVHEVQHDAGAGGGAFEPSGRFAKYRSEFNARWIEANATRDYGDPDQPAPTPSIVRWRWSFATTSGFSNARQHGIFMTLIGIGGSYEFIHKGFVTDPQFRKMVVEYAEPAGGNLVNSVRVNALAELIEAGAAPGAILAAATSPPLDAVDLAFLADYATSLKFWMMANRRLDDATRDQLTLLIEQPRAYLLHVVAKGDTLSKIAGERLGSIERWEAIYALPANRAVIGDDANQIEAGMPLLLPRA